MKVGFFFPFLPLCLTLIVPAQRLLTASARQQFPSPATPSRNFSLIRSGHSADQSLTAFTPSDPFFGNQWALQNTGQFVGSSRGVDIGAPAAWDALPRTQSRQIVVAVIDTGVDYTHPDLATRIWRNTREIPGNGIDDDGNGYADDVVGWNFAGNSNDPRDDHYHGTLVAGVIAAGAGNGIGIAGVAGPADVRIMPLKCFDANAQGTTAGVVAAIDYAVRNGAQIINISWGDREFTPELYNAVRRAVTAGCLVTAAAGNSASDNDSFPVYPAAFSSGANALPAVLSVAAFDEADRLATQSDFGARSVDLAAPGNFIYTTWPGGNYGYSGGTSVAAAFASGVAALVLAKNPTLAGTRVKDILVSSVREVAALRSKIITGGAIHAARALAATPLLAGAGTVTSVSAADFISTTAAPDSIVAAFGTKLATGVEFAARLPLPTSLAGSTVRVGGVYASLFAVTPGQINYLVPSNLPSGPAEVVIVAGDGTISTGTINIASAQPGIFTASQSGTGAPAATWTPDGLRYYAVAGSDGTPLSMDAGAYLILACTGLRHAPDTDGNYGNGVAESVQAVIGGASAAVLYAGAQGVYAGLDQVNIRLPDELRGRGRVELVLTVAGRKANKVVLSVK
ncbi:MAG TPA: S8 family serine peptidase [Blastocatellia bacterium]|nr:S8 family serine peptidase [Blastocatellia bacterium]